MKRNEYFDYLVNNAAEIARAYEKEMVDKVKENKDLEEIDNATRFVDHLGRHENVPAEEVSAALVRLNDIYWNHVA